MSGLEIIPLELAESILIYLTKADVSAISRSSKSLHRLVLPLLYNSISWTVDADYPFYAFGVSVHLLLRSILHRPDLGMCIKHLTMQTIHYKWDKIWNLIALKDEDRYTQPLLDEDRNIAVALIQRMGLPEPPEKGWREHLIAGDICTMVSLLISQLPLLRSLEIGYELLSNNRSLATVLSHMIPHPLDSATISGFQHLQHVNLGAAPLAPDERKEAYEILEFNLQQFLPCFCYPSLESAEMLLPDNESYWDELCCELRWPAITWPLGPPTNSSLTTLALRRCRIYPNNLRTILSLLPNLHTLEYDLWLHLQQLPLDLPALNIALLEVSGTLEQLKISVSPYDPECTGSPEAWGSDIFYRSLGSLRNFYRLTKLEVSVDVLLGWHRSQAPQLADIMPCNIREVYFRDDFRHYDEWEWKEEYLLLKFKEWLNSWKSRPTDLRLLKLLAWNHKNIWNEVACAELFELCNEREIRGLILRRRPSYTAIHQNMIASGPPYFE